MDKSIGNTNYENIFKNRTAHDSKEGPRRRRKCGNSISLRVSRPTFNIKSGRIFDLALNKSIEKHYIIDILPEPSTTQTHLEKNILPQAVCLNYRKTNTQNHKENKSNYHESRQRKEYMIDLPEIHENLYIGNSACIEYFMTFGKTIIYFSDIDNTYYFNKNMSQKIKWINFKDSKTLAYNEFKNICNKTIEVIKNNINNGALLLVCESGVNRSISMATVYGMINTKKSLQDVSLYIDNRKCSVSNYWNNLTNFRIRKLLALYSSEIHNMNINSQSI